MKYVVSFILFTGIFLFLKYSTAAPQEENQKNTTKWFFDEDSGYVTKEQFLPFLQAKELTDTTPKEPYNGPWHYVGKTDTIGKYYKLDSENVILCAINHTSDFETHKIMQLSRLGNDEIGLVKSEEYLHGNYSCCWNGFDGFNKKGDFFSLKLCGTGSGFCSADLYFFKDFKPQSDISKISLEYGFSDGETKYEEQSVLGSTYDLINDSTLLFKYNYSYRYKKARWKEFKLKDRAECEVRYMYRNGYWVTPDSNCLKKIHTML
jgi:hypothetical protein